MIHKALLSRIIFACFMVLHAGVGAAPGSTERANLKSAHDPLSLNSSVALVADADSLEVLYAKNPSVVLPIASITKLMTVVVTLEAALDLAVGACAACHPVSRQATNARALIRTPLRLDRLKPHRLKQPSAQSHQNLTNRLKGLPKPLAIS